MTTRAGHTVQGLPRHRLSCHPGQGMQCWACHVTSLQNRGTANTVDDVAGIIYSQRHRVSLSSVNDSLNSDEVMVWCAIIDLSLP
jgi:hypothetical protein